MDEAESGLSWSGDDEEDEEEEEASYETSLSCGDLLNKNTDSFRCLAQMRISRSSLLLDPFYWFPEIQDPKLDHALWADEPPPVYDNIGREKYIDVCKAEGLRPYRRVLENLASSTLDLSFFGLSTVEVKTVCDALATNAYVKTLNLEENRLDAEGLRHVDRMLQKNTCITKLNLRECRIGPAGAQSFREGFAFNHSLLDVDLSFNELGDDGAKCLAHAFHKNKYIRKVNLSHNELSDGALTELGNMFEENYSIMELDLSWNMLDGQVGLAAFFEGLLENMSLKKLNMAWCGIGDRDSMRPLFNYLRAEMSRVEHLDLSNNRITGIAVKMLKSALKLNESLVTLNLSSNPMVPSEVDFLASVFLEPRETPFCLNLIDMSHMVVNKSFIKIRNQCRRRGFTVKVERILSNYKIRGPNLKHVLLERAKFVALTQKKKKFRQDIGIFLICMPDDPLTRTDFIDIMKKKKVKLDPDLLDLMFKTFVNEKKEIDPKQMKESYLELYPDTKPPEKKKKKKKGRKKKQVGQGEQGAPQGDQGDASTTAGDTSTATEAPTTDGATTTEGEQTATDAEATTDTEGEAPPVEGEQMPVIGEEQGAQAAGETAANTQSETVDAPPVQEPPIEKQE